MRVKRGQNKNIKHKKVLAQAKGYTMSHSKLYRQAKEALLHAGQYSLMHRRRRQSQFRSMWIERINAACRTQNISYSRFISGLKKDNIVLDKKILAYLAFNHETAFTTLVEKVK